MNRILLLLILLTAGLFPIKKLEKKFMVFQGVDFLYDTSELTMNFDKNLGDYFNDRNDLFLSNSAYVNIQQTGIRSRTVIRYLYFYAPVDLTYAVEKRRIYNPDFTGVADGGVSTNRMFIFQPGVYVRALYFWFGLRYNLRTQSREILDSNHYFNYFNIERSGQSLSLHFKMELQAGKLPIYLLGDACLNPASGFRFGADTIYRLSAGIRMDFTYYSSLRFNYFYHYKDDENLNRNILKFSFRYNFTPELAANTAFGAVLFSHRESPGTMFSLGMSYTFIKK